MAQTVQVSISDQAKALIDEFVQSGRYGTVDEVVDAALAMMHAGADLELRDDIDDARRKIEAGIASLDQKGGVPAELVKEHLRSMRAARTRNP